MEKLCFYHFGHSFPKRLFHYITDSNQTVAEVLNIPTDSSMFIT